MSVRRYSFSGHESFICKSLWLKKGYDFIMSNRFFTDADAVVYLGVGKNMVTSIRYWLKVFNLTQNDQPTELAHLLLANEGCDCFLEDNVSLWILHYHLVKSNIASIYNLTFLQLQRETKTFDKDYILSYIKRKCSVPEQKNVYNENTVKKDIRVLLQNYSMPLNTKTYEDFMPLLLDLQLIRKTEEGGYAFNEIDKNNLPHTAVYYALLDSKGKNKIISFDELQNISLTFCIPMDKLIEIIQELEQKHPNNLHFTDDSGIKNVHFLTDIDKFELLREYYK